MLHFHLVNNRGQSDLGYSDVTAGQASFRFVSPKVYCSSAVGHVDLRSLSHHAGLLSLPARSYQNRCDVSLLYLSFSVCLQAKRATCVICVACSRFLRQLDVQYMRSHDWPSLLLVYLSASCFVFYDALLPIGPSHLWFIKSVPLLRSAAIILSGDKANT